jgi:hypothetical protein
VCSCGVVLCSKEEFGGGVVLLSIVKYWLSSGVVL